MLKRLIESFHKMDKVIFALVIALSLIGIIAVYSSSYYFGEKYYNNPYYFSGRQVFWVVVSFIALFFFINFDYKKLQKLVKPLVLITLILLLAVFIPGIGGEGGGARRWINFRLFSFNPSELAKLVIIIYLAYIFTKKQARLGDFTFGFLPPFLLVSSIFFIILMQSGFSTAAILLTVALILFFAGGASVKHILYIFIVSLPVLVGFIILVAYRKARILSFLNPWEDSSGKGYHLIQSLTSYANGGFIGVGLGNSVQKMGALPAPHTDFIFSVITEEVGLIGALILLALYGVFFIRGIIIAKNCKDLFGQMLAFGITVLITFHALLNVGVSLGVVPPTGVNLPFVSYGGSSVLIMSIAVGILLNISSQTKAGTATVMEEMTNILDDTLFIKS